MEKVGVLEPTMKGVSQLHPHQILIGSIPIELPTTVYVMATFVKEEENVSMTTPRVKVMLTPKRAKINASSTKMANLFQRLLKGQTLLHGLEKKKPQVWDTPEATMYPLSAYNAEKSQNAKSYLEKKKMGIHVWLPICKGSSLWTGGTF